MARSEKLKLDKKDVRVGGTGRIQKAGDIIPALVERSIGITTTSGSKSATSKATPVINTLLSGTSPKFRYRSRNPTRYE